MHLHKYESFFYFCVYLMFLAYGLWQLFSTRDKIYSISKLQFAPGWSWIGRPKDNSNDELEYFKDFLLKNGHWYGIHLVVCELCKAYAPKFRTVAHALVGLAFLIASFKTLSLAIMFVELCSFYLVSKFRSKLFIWTVGVVWMVAINIIKNNDDLHDSLGYREHYYLIISLAWCVLRCLSFGLSYAKRERNDDFSFGIFLGYNLYFPVFVHGPFMIYERYVACIREKPTEHSEIYRYTTMLKRLGKIVFWFFVMEFSLHFIYIHYLERDMDAVRLLSHSYGLYAFGYFMGQFFHVYYFITYGLGIAFASFDGLNPPDPPKCIGCINFYSEMWKNFDRGLYEFLFKYIYAELCSKNSSSIRKIFSAFGTFLFVYIWHGFYMNILIWSILNVACLIMERLLKYAVNASWYKKNVARRLSPSNQERLYAVLGTQIFIPSAFSNFYFFGDEDVGNYFMKITYCNGYYVLISFYCYCLFQSAEYFASLKKVKK